MSGGWGRNRNRGRNNDDNHYNQKQNPVYDDGGHVINWYELNPRVGVYNGDEAINRGDTGMVKNLEVLEIDGSILEGGGQMLRISMSLSCILGRKIRVKKIRAGRSKPGLGAQHLTGMQLLALMCNGTLIDGVKGSCDIEFTPGPLYPCQEVFGITGTAGSISLLLQTLLPVLLFSPSYGDKGNFSTSIKLMGGTDADFAPPIDYYRYVFLKYLQQICPEAEQYVKVRLNRRGFFPRGAGAVTADIERTAPAKITGFSITNRGKVRNIVIEVYSAGDRTTSRARECLTAAEGILRQKYPAIQLDTNSKILDRSDYFGEGWGIQITVHTDTQCILSQTANGSPKKSPKTIAEDVVRRICEHIDCGACVDTYMQDQLVIFMFLAVGKSQIKTGPLTLHTKTAIHICQLFDEDIKFDVTKVADDEFCQANKECYIIECIRRNPI